MSRKTKNLVRQLSSSLNEKDVENAWRGFIVETYSGGTFTSPHKCDGFLQSGPANILCEFKFNPAMKEQRENLPVIAQTIYYIKKFIDAGDTMPNVVFIADKNECFVLPIGVLIPYTKRDYDWNLSPSEAGKNLRLIADLMKDTEINPVVFDITDDFEWEPVHHYMIRQINQLKADIAITASILPKVFEHWSKNVINETLDDNRSIEIFYKVLTNPQDCYPHPKKDGCMIVGSSEVKIKKRGYAGFFSLYKETHNPVEVRELTANKDRLITEVRRRRTGAFFTPSDWVDEAHNMLTEHLGPDWRDEYIVWDCSCGTANLTRDYGFKELYLSTLEETDINIIREAGYNPSATVFQFDFLNDGLDKLPEGLLKALESGKKIVFLNNPPYGTAQTFGRSGDAKTGISTNSYVYNLMESKNVGGSSQNLYAQFMYRIIKIIEQYKLSNAFMSMFTKANFMTGKQFEGFRNDLNTLKFIDGMLFQASHFSDVADAWGIAFTIFKS